MKAYSFRQMKDAGIRVDNYKANEREGEFIATLDVKRWGTVCCLQGRPH